MASKRSRARASRSTPSAAPAAAEPKSKWIFGAPGDLALVVAAPAWIVPAMFLMAGFAGDRGVNTAVMALGSIGHHLPGMMRAYGDRALFKRFRARFIVAPIALLTLAFALASRGLHALMFIAFVWGVWHALMQTYGFARIYAAKAGAGDRRSSSIDFALVATWFIGAIFLSPLRLGYLIDMAATCGLPFPAVEVVKATKWITAVALAIVTLAWLVDLARRGRRASPLSIALMVVSIAFWWFANVRVRHPLLSAPLFELFHDVQYLAIVWGFNRRRNAAAPGEMRSLLRALFRPSLILQFVYIAAVLSYGALGLFQPSGPMGDVWNGLLGASQLLHFYYDGFIWKVRDPATAAPLGVTAADARVKETPQQASKRSGIRHVLLWTAIAAATLGLGVAEAQGGRTLRERIPSLVTLVPDNGLYQFYAAEMHWERGEHAAALDGFRRSLALDPDYEPSRNNLALSLTDLADKAAAAGDSAQLRNLVDELTQLRPALAGDVARHVDEELVHYRH